MVVVEPGTAAQRARQSLLAASDPANIPNPAEHEVPEHFGSPLQVFPSRVTPTPSGPAPPSCGERSAGRRFTAASKLALGRRETQARQLQLFRRLYSDLEREATRQRRVRQSLQGSAERRRREQEVQRRAVEEGLAGEDSVLSRGSSLEVERERLEEWQETVALERRRHQLQTTRETERYVEALRAQLRERLASCPTPLPPLCSCGSTVWDTDPQTCANNCPFYRNPRGTGTLWNMCVMSIVASFEILLLCSICQGSGQPPDVSETLTALTFNLLVYMYMQTIEVLLFMARRFYF